VYRVNATPNSFPRVPAANQKKLYLTVEVRGLLVWAREAPNRTVDRSRPELVLLKNGGSSLHEPKATRAFSFKH
jgi:hypothetical protein